MANLQKFRTHEALNTTAAGNFSVADAASGGLGGSSGAQITAGSSASTGNTNTLTSLKEHTKYLYMRLVIFILTLQPQTLTLMLT